MTVKLTPSQKKTKVLKAQDIFGIMQQVLRHENKFDRNKEHFWLACLAQNNSILMIELISLGSSKSTLVEPMDVFSFALQKQAAKLIMVHNHPSGEMQPSRADIDVTERMHAIGLFIRMPVLDHLIISERDFYSFKEAGLMDKIEREKRYDLTFAEVDKLNAQLQKMAKEKAAAEKKVATAEKKRSIEMAKQMLLENLPIDQIIRISGLTKREVEKLR
jgi:DNA repair protein RadC